MSKTSQRIEEDARVEWLKFLREHPGMEAKNKELDDLIKFAFFMGFGAGGTMSVKTLWENLELGEFEQ